MSSSLSRREFLGTAAVGGALASRVLRGSPILAGAVEGWPAMKPARIHKVYVGRTGDIYLSRPTEEIAKFDTHLA
ncbi:MAG: twin-arginine translocation signal domain-containing protein, partial [Candidatus Omnitrophica bacterium]|nr:twin-arginine translocation signal domain-containing protein [Candidatus Omnitrophota bacterium]